MLSLLDNAVELPVGLGKGQHPHPFQLQHTMAAVRINEPDVHAVTKGQFHVEYGTDIEGFLDSIYLAGADLGGTELEHHANWMDKSVQISFLLIVSTFVICCPAKFSL